MFQWYTDERYKVTMALLFYHTIIGRNENNKTNMEPSRSESSPYWAVIGRKNFWSSCPDLFPKYSFTCITESNHLYSIKILFAQKG